MNLINKIFPFSEDYIEENFKENFKENITKSLSFLKDRDRDIVMMRWGLDGNEQLTLSSIGKIVGLSSTRVRQIEMKAIRMLRNPCRLGKFSNFLE